MLVRVCPLLFTRMKAAVVCALIAHVTVMTSSQPTYDLEQLQSECGCQQSDEKLEITVNSLKNKVAAMNEKVSAIDNKVAAVKGDLEQLRQQVQPTPETPGTSGPGVTSRPGVTYGPPIRHTGESCEVCCLAFISFTANCSLKG